MKPVTILFLALALVACSQSSKPEEDAEIQATASAGNTAESTTPALSISTLSVTPVASENCKPKSYTAEIAWFVPKNSPEAGFEVRVKKPDGRLLTYKKAKQAKATTGNWVSPGMKFYLLGHDSKSVLATAEASEFACGR